LNDAKTIGGRCRPSDGITETMITSMTGFAAAAREDERAAVNVSVKSVNHRHLDAQLRVPQSLAALEGELRALVGRYVSRGRVELMLTVQWRQPATVEVVLNEPFVRALETALDQARATGVVAGAMTPGDLLRLPQAISVREAAIDTDPEALAALHALVRDAVAAALSGLSSMRSAEGEHLRNDLDARKSTSAGLVERIALAAEAGRVAMEQRLAERVAALRTELQADEVAVAQEIVRVAGRSDISEELARFRAHVAHWETLVDASEPCGRKLDFLLQEMNREINTMGSKADGLAVSELIIAAKAELEKMREQVQNVE
jgi:uncharacterized protein (TIGR00255 family)